MEHIKTSSYIGGKSLFRDNIGHIVITPTGAIYIQQKGFLGTEKRIYQGVFPFCCNACPDSSPSNSLRVNF